MTLSVVPVRSDAPERLGGGHTGGADGGQQPGQGTDDDGRGQAAGPGPGRNDEEIVLGIGAFTRCTQPGVGAVGLLAGGARTTADG